MSKDAYYFPHDSNAKSDPNMLLMRSKYGSAGYGNYFMIVEMLRDEDGYRMKISKHTYESIALTVGIKPELAKEFVDDLVSEFSLLSRSRNHLWSESLLRRMSKLDDLRAKRAKAGKLGGLAKSGKQNPSNATAPPKQGSSSIVDLPSRPSKVKKFKPPTLEEVQAYAKERKNTTIKPQRFLDHYAANGWIRGKTPIKNWKACWRTWEGNESGEDADLREREAAASRRKPTACSSCSTKPPVSPYAFCKDCAWCWACDEEGKDKVPISQLRPDPKTGRALCQDHLKSKRVAA